MQQDSRHIFLNLLTSSFGEFDFKSKISALLQRDPYYVPALLEHLWFAEKSADRSLLQDMIRYSENIVDGIFSDTFLRKRLEDTWTEMEIDALKEMMEVQLAHESSFLRRQKIRLQSRSVDHLLQLKTVTAPTGGRYLKKEKHIEVASLQKEIQEAESFWWNIFTERAQTISYHRHTRSLILRYLLKYTSEYHPVDGVHESRTVDYIDRFPRTHKVILEFAKERNMALGRVAVVWLGPRKQAYRHYDHDPYLEGRNRYHLVIQCGENNILTSGTETVHAHEGEFWFFDNKVMHRAHNKSSVPRIHVIFDAYPLPEVPYGSKYVH